MGRDKGLRLNPALVSSARSPYVLSAESLMSDEGQGQPAALTLTPIFNQEHSSAPPRLPPFVIRLPSHRTYPYFPLTD